MFIANPAFAETCVNDYGGNNSCVEGRTYGETAGDCAKLGYTDTATSCADGESFLKCPFDESKGRCIEKNPLSEKGDCTALGYTSASCADGETSVKCPFDQTKLLCVDITAPVRTCEELGFTETSCDEGVNSMKCPIEETPQKYACGEIKGKTCTELGFTIFDKSEWCSSIRSCEENGVTYTLCGAVREKKVNPPVIRFGDIKYVVWE